MCNKVAYASSVHVTSDRVTVVVRLAAMFCDIGTAVVCVSVHSLRFSQVYSQYINYTLCILGKHVLFADLLADAKRTTTYHCSTCAACMR